MDDGAGPDNRWWILSPVTVVASFKAHHGDEGSGHGQFQGQGQIRSV
jgi:hypothetical protein